MKYIQKIDGEVFEGNESLNKTEYNIKILENFINYDEVNKNKYRQTSTTMTTLSKFLDANDIDYFYDLIINCPSREALVELLYKFVTVTNEKFMYYNENKKYKTFATYTTKYEERYNKDLKSVNESLDTGMYCMVSKVISAYYRKTLDLIIQKRPESKARILKCYKLSADGICDIFPSIKQIQDESIRNFIITKIKSITRARETKSTTTHLCFDCPLGYGDTCPKVAAPWGKHITDFDFITDGVEIDYESGDEREREDDAVDSLVSTSNVKSINVTGCLLEAQAREKNIVRKRIFTKNTKNN